MIKPNWWWASERKCDLTPREQSLVLPMVADCMAGSRSDSILADVMEAAFPALAQRLRDKPTTKALLNCLRVAGLDACARFHLVQRAIMDYANLTRLARIAGFGAIEADDAGLAVGVVGETEELAFDRDDAGWPIYPPIHLLMWVCNSTNHCARLTWCALDGLDVPQDVAGGMGPLTLRLRRIVEGSPDLTGRKVTPARPVRAGVFMRWQGVSLTGWRGSARGGMISFRCTLVSWSRGGGEVMPSVSAKRVRVGRAFMDLVIAALSVDPGAAVLVTPKVHFSKDPAVVINENSVLADLEAGEADFTGYTGAGYTFTPSAPITLDEGVRGVAGNVLPVVGTADPQVTNTITAWWIDNGTIFVAGEKFEAGSEVAMVDPGDYIDLLAVLPFSVDVRMS